MPTKANEINIWSFYGAPEALFDEMRTWREFSSSEDYSVALKDETTGEIVTVGYIDEIVEDYLTIKSDAPGEFFDRVVGRVVRVLSERSGYLKIRRTPYDEERLSTPKFKCN